PSGLHIGNQDIGLVHLSDIKSGIVRAIFFVVTENISSVVEIVFRSVEVESALTYRQLPIDKPSFVMIACHENRFAEVSSPIMPYALVVVCVIRERVAVRVNGWQHVVVLGLQQKIIDLECIVVFHAELISELVFPTLLPLAHVGKRELVEQELPVYIDAVVDLVHRGESQQRIPASCRRRKLDSTIENDRIDEIRIETTPVGICPNNRLEESEIPSFGDIPA